MVSPLLLKAQDLTHHYGSGETLTIALREVTLELPPHCLTLVMGPSGCGKSTLLAILSGLLRPTSGKVFLGNDNLYSWNAAQRREYRLRHFGFIFQGYNLFPTLTVREQLEMVLRWGEGLSASAASRRTDEILDILHMGRKGGMLPQQLSGGEKQRAAIGRALIKTPDFLFADEPTSALDWEHGKQVLEILSQAAHAEGSTVLVVSHDPRSMDYADRVIHLEDGALKETQG